MDSITNCVFIVGVIPHIACHFYCYKQIINTERHLVFVYKIFWTLINLSHFQEKGLQALGNCKKEKKPGGSAMHCDQENIFAANYIF